MLIGGPGNGKTEAIESTIRWLDEALECRGALVLELAAAFSPAEGQAVPRTVQVDAGHLGASGTKCHLTIVQDASVLDGTQPGKSRAQLLIEELNEAVRGGSDRVYLCCVNRGVLDDALIYALERRLDDTKALLETITQGVSLTPDAPACWPLAGFESIAVWPMDVESLLVPPDNAVPSPASALLDYVTAEGEWPREGECPAGAHCPYCGSRSLLAGPSQKAALVQILRWYELASGKRWSFRDLFSLISYLLAGVSPQRPESAQSPCASAAKLLELDKKARDTKPDRDRSTAIFHLTMAGYQHALFSRWLPNIANQFRADIKELGLEHDHTLMGLQFFLRSRRASVLPATIASLLDGLVDLLDPALANPDEEIPVSARTKLRLRDIDTRFSQSVAEGMTLLRRYRCLSPVETELLDRIAQVDGYLSTSDVRRRRPMAASRIQRILRDFACRLVRRSLGARSAVVPDADILEGFQKIVEDTDGNGDLLYDASKQVEKLLNKGERFEVSLTTTFGQPLPPMSRRAILVVPKQRVKVRETIQAGRPRHPICFLSVGTGETEQAIALTYDLFKSVKELERGMSPASLPRPVLALLDTTKARLSGPIVRDEDILEDAEIRIGTSAEAVARSRGRFVGRKEPKE